MNSTKAIALKVISSISGFLAVINYNVTVFAGGAEKFKLGNDRFKFDEFDGLLSNGIRYAQYIGGGIALAYIVFNGIKIISSSDSHRAMEEAKGGMWKVVLGSIILIMAPTIFELVFNAVNKK